MTLASLGIEEALGADLADAIARELLDVVSANSEYLATAIPGFTAALRWPQ